MLVCMTNPEITAWVTKLSAIHGQVAATATRAPQDEGRSDLACVLEALEDLYGEMLRAEIRAAFSSRPVDGRRV